MTNIPKFSDLQFHDSSLDDIAVEGSTVRMVFEDILYPPLETDQDDYPLISLTLWIEGVTRIVQNSQPVQTLAIRGSDGGVVSLERTKQEVVLAVTWYHLEPGARDDFSLISLSGPDLEIRCGPYTYQQSQKRD